MRQKVYKILADLRFAISILLIIASLSIIGTVIEQEQAIEVYKLNYPLANKLFGFLSWDIILKLGLDHIYKTWWFIFFIILFAISLLSCTFLQQLPALKIARKCQFFRTPKPFQLLLISLEQNYSTISQLIFKIKNEQYSIFQQKNILYCYKGLIGRIAPIVVHISIILVLVGAVLGALTGFKAQEIIPKTETFHIQNIITDGKITMLPKLGIRVNDFWITYTKQKTINQFYSDISVLDWNGNEIKQKTVFVNAPLTYSGIDFYQTDWNLIALRIGNINSFVFQYPLLNSLINQNKIWITWLPLSQNLNTGITVLVNNLQGYLSVYSSLGNFLGNLELNENNNTILNLECIEIISSTGLQIKSDPSIPLVYTGFFFLMVSVLISYITYSQIWVVQSHKNIFIGGNTTRAIFDFELEFLKLVKY